MKDHGSRTALIVHIDSFETPPDRPGRAPDPLPFGRVVDDFRVELAAYEYRTRTCRPATAAHLRAAVRQVVEAAGPDDVVLVYLLTHGQLDKGNHALYALAADGVPSHDSDGDVAAWVREYSAEVGARDRPHLLFLLDICRAGRAGRQDWQLETMNTIGRTWVVAASESDENAFNARLTQAVTGFLRELRDPCAAAEIDHQLSYVPWEFFIRKVRAGVLEMGRDGTEQRIVTTPYEPSLVPDPLPFFRNPLPLARDQISDTAFRISDTPFASGRRDGGTELFDACHFTDMAMGGGVRILPAGESSFRDRDKVMRALSGWLRAAYGEDARPGGGTRPGDALRVVTGRAGAGKSALLGMLACQLHPGLRPATRGWRREWPGGLPRTPAVAAVHCRDLTVGLVCRSIDAQLRLDAADAGPVPLLRALRSMRRPALIILDAVDEALDPAALATDLMEPLGRQAAAGDRPALRLVAGARSRSPVVDLLCANGLPAGALLDLDREEDADQLRDELFLFAQTLLLAGAAADRASAAAFATALVDRLVPAVAGDRTEWGEYLIATFHLRAVRANAGRLTDPARAAELGAAVDPDLGALVELDLAGHAPHLPWLRPVLGALACARGTGMPAEVIRSAAQRLGPAGTRLDHPTLRTTLDAAKYYTDRAVGAEGVPHYRLFHDSLVARLRDTLGEAGQAAVFEALLDSVPRGGRGRRDWRAAPPYVRRHLLDHPGPPGQAARLLGDAGFLLLGSAEIGAAVDARSTDPAPADRRAALVARAVLDRDAALPASPEPGHRRTQLAIEAARLDAPGLAAALVDDPRGPAPWCPRWVAGPRPAPGAEPAPAGASGVGPAPGGAMLVAAHPGPRVAMYRLDAGPVPVWERSVGAPGRFTVVMAYEEDGRATIVTGGTDHMARLWRPGTRHRRWLSGHGGAIRSLARVGSGPGTTILTGSDDKTIRRWDRNGAPIDRPVQCGVPVRFIVLATVDGVPLALTAAAAGGLNCWRLPLFGWYAAIAGAVRVRAATTIDLSGRSGGATAPGLVLLGEDGTVGVWDLSSRSPVAEHRMLARVRDPLAVTLPGGRYALVGTGGRCLAVDATVVPPRFRPVAELDDDITGLAGTVLTGGPAAVIADAAGSVTVHPLSLGAPFPAGGPSPAEGPAIPGDPSPAGGPTGGPGSPAGGAAAGGSFHAGPESSVTAIGTFRSAPVCTAVPGRSPAPDRVVAVAADRFGDEVLVAAAGADGVTRVVWLGADGGTPVRRRLTLDRHAGADGPPVLREIAGRPFLLMPGSGTAYWHDLSKPGEWSSTPAGPPTTRYPVSGDPGAGGLPSQPGAGGSGRRPVSADVVLHRGTPRMLRGSDDGTADLAEVDGYRLTGHRGPVHCVRAIRGPGESRVLTGGADGTVRLWRVDDATEIDRLDLGTPVEEIHTVAGAGPHSRRHGAGAPDRGHPGSASSVVVVRAGGAVYVFEHLDSEGKRP